MTPDITLQGSARTYRVNWASTNARCRIEELTGQPCEQVFRELAGKRRPRSMTVRAFLAAVLVEPPKVSAEEVGRILEDLGGVPVLRKAAQAAWRGRKGRA